MVVDWRHAIQAAKYWIRKRMRALLSTQCLVRPCAGRNVALYERITRIFAEAGAALRSRQVCEALGMPVEAWFIEAMRPKNGQAEP
jgi:hypothetical protein